MRVGRPSRLGSTGARGLVVIALSLSAVLAAASSARAQFAEAWGPPTTASAAPAAMRRPLRVRPPMPLDERVAIQLVATLPLLALAVGAEYATLDGLRRPCSGGFGHCVGRALANGAAIGIVPVGFSVVSALVLSVIANEARPATIVGFAIGALTGALVIGGAYVLDPLERGPFTLERDARFVTAMACGGALAIAGGMLGGALASQSARSEARERGLIPLVSADGDGFQVGIAGTM